MLNTINTLIAGPMGAVLGGAFGTVFGYFKDRAARRDEMAKLEVENKHEKEMMEAKVTAAQYTADMEADKARISGAYDFAIEEERKENSSFMNDYKASVRPTVVYASLLFAFVIYWLPWTVLELRAQIAQGILALLMTGGGFYYGSRFYASGGVRGIKKMVNRQ